MLRNAVLGCLAGLAMFAGGDQNPEPADEFEGCPPETGPVDVIVEVVKFDGGEPSYSFRVTNNDEGDIDWLVVGEDGELPPFIMAPETIPTSIGAPKGWEGKHIVGQDWREHEHHSPSFIHYVWYAKDANVRIQPGESLSGFSVQLPARKAPDSREQRETVHSDLTKVSFLTGLYGNLCPGVGTVRLNSPRSGDQGHR